MTQTPGTQEQARARAGRHLDLIAELADDVAQRRHALAESERALRGVVAKAMDDPLLSKAEIARASGLSRPTLYAYAQRAGL